MTRKFHTYARALCTWQTTVCTLMSVVALLAVLSGPSLAVAPTIGLTKVGSPIWRPGDFQMFTAPADPFPAAFFATLDSLLPLEGPGVATYTPHAGPYDTELSTNAAAAGSQRRFRRGSRRYSGTVGLNRALWPARFPSDEPIVRLGMVGAIASLGAAGNGGAPAIRAASPPAGVPAASRS